MKRVQVDYTPGDNDYDRPRKPCYKTEGPGFSLESETLDGLNKEMAAWVGHCQSRVAAAQEDLRKAREFGAELTVHIHKMKAEADKEAREARRQDLRRQINKIDNERRHLTRQLEDL